MKGVIAALILLTGTAASKDCPRGPLTVSASVVRGCVVRAASGSLTLERSCAAAVAYRVGNEPEERFILDRHDCRFAPETSPQAVCGALIHRDSSLVVVNF